MSVKNIIEEIENDVIDVINTTFVHNDTNIVPGASDIGLTYERGTDKKGKRIETCVLYVDIRNSVALTEKHHTQTMGRIYTAFTKAVLKVARHHNGHTRNIIGDRVMIVFPSNNCFTNAIDCAISINHIAQYVINKQFKGVDFKCGIGIDYGELRVIKVGIQRNGTENGENKGLVWVGYPANIASRLTDNANKLIEETYFEVIRNPINPRAIRPIFPFDILTSLQMPTKLDNKPNFPYSILKANLNKTGYDPQAPLYLSTEETVEMTLEEFANCINSIKDGELYMAGGKFIRFSKKTRKFDYPPILMTEKVYSGYKKQNLTKNDISHNYWKEQIHKIKNVNVKVYGGDVQWEI